MPITLFSASLAVLAAAFLCCLAIELLRAGDRITAFITGIFVIIIALCLSIILMDPEINTI